MYKNIAPAQASLSLYHSIDLPEIDRFWNDFWILEFLVDICAERIKSTTSYRNYHTALGHFLFLNVRLSVSKCVKYPAYVLDCFFVFECVCVANYDSTCINSPLNLKKHHNSQA